MNHSDVVDAYRKAQDEMWASGLNPEQQQSLVDLMNAVQDLNNLYWQQVYAAGSSPTEEGK